MPCAARVWGGVRGWGAALVLGLAFLAGPGQAQTQPVSAQTEYNILFQRVLREPANLDLSFRFAEVATSLGDYEAAIGALERMIFFNPNLPRVRLELGILYFRLGSYEMARSYFTSAIAEPGVPADIRIRVEGFLAEIDRRLRRTQWSVYAQTGLRYQTNANAGPSSPNVLAGGQNAILDRQFVNRPDWNAFGLAAVRHIYDFENQRGDVWETNLIGYYARQFRFTRLNLGLAEIQTGPRLALFPDQLPGWSVRPYLLANGVTLGDNYYLSSLGAGLAVSVPIAPFLVLEPYVEVRDRRFYNSFEYPLAKEQSGHLWTAGVLGQGTLFGGVRWQGRLAFIRNDTTRRNPFLIDYNSYDQVAIDAAFPIEFDGPWGSRPWSFVPAIGWGRYNYDQPNPIIDPFIRRRDHEWRVGWLLDVPLYEWFGVSVQMQYSEIKSNLPNFDTNNLSVVLGPTVRF